MNSSTDVRIAEYLKQLLQLSFGTGRPPVIMTGTDAFTAPEGMPWCVLMAVEETVFADIKFNGTTITGSAGLTIPAGFPIYGQFTTVGLTSGSVIAYHSTPVK